jgi:hypothetical protein
MRYLVTLLFAVVLACLPSCSRKEVFNNEKAAQAVVARKRASDVIKRLGTPDNIVTADRAKKGLNYTEFWKYPRLVRDASGDLQTLNVYFHKGVVVNTTVGDN